MKEQIKQAIANADSATWQRSYFEDGTPYMSIMGTDCVTFAENAMEWCKQLVSELDDMRRALEDVADYQHRWSDKPIFEVQKIAKQALERSKYR